MPCKCQNPNDIRKLVEKLESDSTVVDLIVLKCGGYHLVDGVDEFALIGLSDEERDKLVRAKWCNIGKSYLWFKDGKEKI